MKILYPVVVLFSVPSCKVQAEKPHVPKANEASKPSSPTNTIDASPSAPGRTADLLSQQENTRGPEPSEDIPSELVNLVASKRRIDELRGDEVDQQLKALFAPRFVEKTDMHWVFEGSAPDRGIRSARIIFNPLPGRGDLLEVTFFLSATEPAALEATLEKKLRAKLRKPPLWNRTKETSSVKGWNLSEDWQIALNIQQGNVELVVALRND